ncbi:hypothetical protein RI129_006096 [Pyrocoelia pectoralis]|uniref:Uncharacterized protein n=1 Tax=Pyrocoelia pectoralis TaxID=417401 RepID=A0AAN7ZP71_9COLE
MAVRITCVLVLFIALAAVADDSIENVGLRIAFKVFDECSKSDGLSPCLKKKALTFLDRLGRMDKLEISDDIKIVKVSNSSKESESPVSEEQLEKNLPRNVNARDAVLTDMLWNKVTSLVQTRNIEFSMPRLLDSDDDEDDDEVEEGRKGSIGGKKKKKIGKKGGGMMMGMMMGIMGKMMALIPIGIAGLFLLAGKALITSKIALLLSGIIAIKKLVAAKQGDDGGHQHVVATSGHGGWDKRSLEESQKLAYSASAPKQD